MPLAGIDHVDGCFPLPGDWAALLDGLAHAAEGGSLLAEHIDDDAAGIGPSLRGGGHWQYLGSGSGGGVRCLGRMWVSVSPHARIDA